MHIFSFLLITMRDAAFMNTVRWKLTQLAGAGYTFGYITKKNRISPGWNAYLFLLIDGLNPFLFVWIERLFLLLCVIVNGNVLI